MRYLESLRELARGNRNNSTRTEEILWYEILSGRKLGYKFIRQKPIGRFVADFYCSKLLMIVEVDGGSHILRENYDAERDKYFNILRIVTVRVKGIDLQNNLDGVRKRLKLAVSEREQLFKNSPLSRGGGPPIGGPEGF